MLQRVLEQTTLYRDNGALYATEEWQTTYFHIRLFRRFSTTAQPHLTSNEEHEIAISPNFTRRAIPTSQDMYELWGRGGCLFIYFCLFIVRSWEPGSWSTLQLEFHVFSVCFVDIRGHKNWSNSVLFFDGMPKFGFYQARLIWHIILFSLSASANAVLIDLSSISPDDQNARGRLRNHIFCEKAIRFFNVHPFGKHFIRCNFYVIVDKRRKHRTRIRIPVRLTWSSGPRFCWALTKIYFALRLNALLVLSVFIHCPS